MSLSNTKFTIFCLAALALHCRMAPAAEESGEGRFELDPVVVVATRAQRPLSEIAAQVTVIDAADIRERLAEDLDGVLRYEPGLDLETSGTRFGATAINIRGIGGNRVAIEIDGIPVRDQFVIGAYSNAGRVPIEPDRIKRVEVLHGPASVMYGSKAIGGVVAVTTWDPDDLTAFSDRPVPFELRGGYQGIDDSWVASGMAAWSNDAHGLLAAGTHRDGHESGNQAPPGTPTDAQDWTQDDYLVRYTWDSPAGNRVRLTADRLEREADTQMRSLLGQPPRFRNTTALSGDDRDLRRRLALDFEFATPSWQQGVLRLSRVDHDTDQFSYEERATAATPVAIERRFLYEHDETALEAYAFRDFDWGASRHRVGLGAEWLRSDISELRDGLQTSLEDGSTTRFILGEAMPVRDFPVSETDEVGLWVQDEIAFADGRWQLLPALRWDAYRLDSEPDAIWRADNPDTAIVDIDESRVTPRLGLLYRTGERWSLYTQYAAGFRAPPFQDANIGFDLPLFGYRAIPNPDLRSETSETLEAGLRWLGAESRVALTLFHSDYDDFIESRVLIGRDPASGDLLFQSRNLERARIRGADLRYDQRLSAWSDRLAGWTLSLAAYWAEGDDRTTDAPLNSIAPPQAVLGLDWRSGDDAWDLAATGTFTAAKHADDIDDSDEARFATPSWAALDLTAGWRPLDHIELRAGVFNLTDERYWRWLDVANLAANDPVIPLLSRPGRSYSVSLRLSF
ncbi:MAG: TonB-dependent hemoglobin/transferrin/lactoferrin family receptor [Xanthomonadales bacterium]|nr:TonB-dependent hemoglobin/transferrin/lactoferrin family receptor [Xanthomonadales bacterium]